MKMIYSQRCRLFALSASLIAGLPVFAVEPFAVPRTATKPVADGVIRRDEYRFAATFKGAANYRQNVGKNPKADPRKSECALTWDEDFVYLAVRSATGKDGSLPKGGARDPAWASESVEFWFDPPKEVRAAEFAKFGQFQLTFACDSKVHAMQHNPGFGLPPRPWKIEGARLKQSVVGDTWDCEIAIPAAAFGAEKLDEGEWGVILGRNFRTNPNVQCSFSPFASSGAYTDSSCYSRFAFRKGVRPTRFNGEPESILKGIPLTVPCNITAKVRTTGTCPPRKYRRFFASHDVDGKGYFGLQEVANPDGSVHMTLFYHARARNVFRNFTHNAIPAPGEEATLSLNVLADRLVYYLDGARIGEIVTDVPLVAEDLGDAFPGGGESGVEGLSFRIVPRALAEDEIRLAAQEGKGLAGDVKWYPSKSLLACELSFPKPAKKSELPVLTLRDARGRKLLERSVPAKRESCVVTGGKNPMMVVHEKVAVAKPGEYLPDGDYTVTLVAGKDRATVIEKKIRMKRYPWFNTTVGTQDVLLPGFTPVKAEGRTVEVVGRKYVFGDDGLPQEVWADGKQILARPVALTGRGLPCRSVEDVDKPSVRTLSESQAGVSGTLASGRVEQDGFIVLDLALPETTGDVTLEIPVKKEFATLYHACAEGIRSNPAGFVPAGDGKVFGSRAIPQTHVENFIPYCWVGTDTRGICYAADSDRGWEHCKGRDAVELHREADGTVAIRLNLINGEGPHEARTITVTLMASPAKPMPKGWRGWVDAFDVPAERNTLCNCSNPTWGCYIVGMARYPTFEDWGYVHKMVEAAKTGKVDKDWVEKWIDRCWTARKEHPELVPWLAKKGEDEAKKTLRAHAYAGMNRPCFLHDKKNTVLYYYTCDTDPCTGLYELDVMADEWGKSTKVYGSHQDYAVYYLKRMCEEGMTGVYNDNTFFSCNYDWVSGNAWIDAKGEVHPSFSLWSLRDFCRRQILAMQEAGVKDPWLTLHHTNANILPTMSYATNTMGMEWKYGRSEYQDRYTRDYIRTVNQGLQTGCFPTSLEGIFDITDPAEKTRVTRTMLAALLPHEVQPTLQACGDHKLVVKALTIKQVFGVGAADCEYRAYWDPENPVVQAREDVMVSSYRRGKRMLLVIGSYSNEDVGLKIALKEDAIAAARDAEDGQALPVSGGTLVLPLKNRDFRMVEIKIR